MNNLRAAQAEMKKRMMVERRERKRRAALVAPPEEIAPETPVDDHYKRTSRFYVLQVLPRDERRFKVGYTSCMVNRLAQHKTIAPDCILLRQYPCHPANESFLLQQLRVYPQVKAVSDEVFDIFESKRVLHFLDCVFEGVDMTVPQSDTPAFRSALVRVINS